ncbi:MAG: hypothetical protein GDA43_12050 [Hormoscilla sp. SP5CHS1]|nr:hypothetical protein [Hormoscilla sp. SP5CHS1]
MVLQGEIARSLTRAAIADYSARQETGFLRELWHHNRDLVEETRVMTTSLHRPHPKGWGYRYKARLRGLDYKI